MKEEVWFQSMKYGRTQGRISMGLGLGPGERTKRNAEPLDFKGKYCGVLNLFRIKHLGPKDLLLQL